MIVTSSTWERLRAAARLLVQHILVDGAVAQHAHAFLEIEPFGSDLVKLRLQNRARARNWCFELMPNSP